MSSIAQLSRYRAGAGSLVYDFWDAWYTFFSDSELIFYVPRLLFPSFLPGKLPFLPQGVSHVRSFWMALWPSLLLAPVPYTPSNYSGHFCLLADSPKQSQSVPSLSTRHLGSPKEQLKAVECVLMRGTEGLGTLTS